MFRHEFTTTLLFLTCSRHSQDKEKRVSKLINHFLSPLHKVTYSTMAFVKDLWFKL